MKKILLITNKKKDHEGAYTERISLHLAAHGVESICVSDTASVAIAADGSSLEAALPKEDVFGNALIRNDIDCALVLGGDGTLLKAARDMMEYGIPLLGVNLGTLGYLAEVEIGSIEKALGKLLYGEYIREERMMLDGTVYHKDSTEVHDFALNDIVIARCGALQMLKFEIYVNGRFLNGYSADGIIVATPTGSTGYNMSAGGPIVEPGASLIMLTPICPHTLNTRSIILSSEDEVIIDIPEGREGSEQTVEANFDGTNNVPLRTGDRIVIKKADKTTGILRLNTESFLEILHKKMAD